MQIYRTHAKNHVCQTECGVRLLVGREPRVPEDGSVCVYICVESVFLFVFFPRIFYF